MASVSGLFTMSGKKFYRLFDEMAVNLKEMSSVFAQAIYDNEHMLDEHLKQLRKLEHDNDLVTHRLFIELGRNFITPFDREDIHFLASSLDDIADTMYQVARQLKSYKAGKPDTTMQQIAEQHVKIVKLLAGAVTELKDKRKLGKIVVTLADAKKLVYTCDHAADNAISAIFSNHKDVLDLIKRIEIYNSLQVLMEKCSNVINVLESVVIKYS